MNVATSRVEVGVRELKNNLSRYLGRVSDGEEVIVTDHGRPVARLLSIDSSTDKLADLVEAGLVRPASAARRPLAKPIKAAGTVSDHRRRSATVITYIDSSTLIKLLVDEPGSDGAAEIWLAADSLVSVSLIEVEARAVLAAATRAKRLTAAQHERATASLAELLEQLGLIEVRAELITAASTLADVEGLRGYDAVHLAAALFVEADILTSADLDLCAAATRRGFNIATPA